MLPINYILCIKVLIVNNKYDCSYLCSNILAGLGGLRSLCRKQLQASRSLISFAKIAAKRALRLRKLCPRFYALLTKKGPLQVKGPAQPFPLKGLYNKLALFVFVCPIPTLSFVRPTLGDPA